MVRDVRDDVQKEKIILDVQLFLSADGDRSCGC